MTAYDDLKKDLTAAAEEGQFAIFGQYGNISPILECALLFSFILFGIVQLLC